MADLKYRQPHVPDVIEALRASYAAFDLYWDVQRRLGIPDEVNMKTPNYRNHLVHLADDLERKQSSWRRHDPWRTTPAEHLAVADEIVECYGMKYGGQECFHELGWLFVVEYGRDPSRWFISTLPVRAIFDTVYGNKRGEASRA